MHATAAKSLPLCPTLCDPSRWLPTRLHCPWDSPGQNTGVGCHFLLQGMKVKNESEVTQRPHGLQPARLHCPWDSPGKNTQVGCRALLQGVFLTRGSHPGFLCLPHWRAGFSPLVPPGRAELASYSTARSEDLKLKTGHKTRMPSLITPSQQGNGAPNQGSKAK